MSKTISADEFAKAVSGILDDYSGDCLGTLKEAVQKVAKKSVKTLKGKSIGGFKDRSGKYRKGWRSKIVENRLYVEGTVYNGAQPGLTHLLEFGHATQGGGRSRAFPHIADVNDEAAEEFEKELTSKL